ncbi:hypothetical protein TNCV_3437031 [Trichonephila clavipes]|nr:hypothetical protein TNCV_3437031 [Trichonephila clavipes]
MIYRSSPAVVVLGRPPPTCGLERFPNARNDTFVDSNSAATLVTVCPSSSFPMILRPVDGTGEVVLEVRRQQKTDISSYQQKRNRSTTAQQVANQFLAASGKLISRKTVARRLRGGGLYARRPVVFFPLTRQHHTSRLQWCHEHHNWTEQDWACVLF